MACLPDRSPAEIHDRGTVLREVLVANYDRLHQGLLRHLGCADLASESLHDAWLRLGDAEVRSDVQSPRAYVYRMACNVAMDRLRSGRLRQSGGDADTELDLLIDDSPGPDLIAEGRSDLAAVERAMQHLPRRHRTVMVALRIEERTRQEVASSHQVSLRSLDTMLRQALDHCAKETGHPVLVGVSGPRRALRHARVAASLR